MGGIIFLFIILLLFTLTTPIFEWLCDRAEKKQHQQNQKIKEEAQRHITFEENRRQTEGWNNDDI